MSNKNFKTKMCDVQLFRNCLIKLIEHNLKTSNILINPCEKAVTWSYEKDFLFYELKASLLQVKVGEKNY